MKLWIDDMRPAPPGYVWITSVNEVKEYCRNHINEIEEFNLDHDAGDYWYSGGDYINILSWLEERVYEDNWAINASFHIHSQNPVGIQNMKAVIRANNWKEV